RFRYDVTLHLGAKQEVAPPPKWVMWDLAGQWEAELEQALAGGEGQAIGLGGMRDVRVARAVAAVNLLQNGEATRLNPGQVRWVCGSSRGRPQYSHTIR